MNTPDLLASFRAYVRAASARERAWHGIGTDAEVKAAFAAERTAREAHETALRAVGER